MWGYLDHSAIMEYWSNAEHESSHSIIYMIRGHGLDYKIYATDGHTDHGPHTMTPDNNTVDHWLTVLQYTI